MASTPLVLLVSAAIALTATTACWQLWAWRRRRQRRQLGVVELRGELLAVEAARAAGGADLLALTITGRSGRQRVWADPSAMSAAARTVGRQLAIHAVRDELLPTGEVLYRESARTEGFAALLVEPRWSLRPLLAPALATVLLTTLVAALGAPSRRSDPVRDSARGVVCLPGARRVTRPLYDWPGWTHLCLLPDGRRHGDVAKHDRHGHRRELQRFEQGIAHGPYFHRNLVSGANVSGAFWRGERHGPWRHFDSGGTLRSLVVYAKGRRHGRFETRDERGSLKGGFEQDLRSGPWRGVGRSCRPSSELLPLLGFDGWVRSKATREDRTLDPSAPPYRLLGERCSYRAGRLHGPLETSLHGFSITGRYERGRAQGAWRGRSAGQLVWTARFAGGSLDGVFRVFYPGGGALEGTFRRGRPTGHWKRYARGHGQGPPRDLVESWRIPKRASRRPSARTCWSAAALGDVLYERWRARGRLLLRGHLAGGWLVRGRWTVFTERGLARTCNMFHRRPVALCRRLERSLRDQPPRLPAPVLREPYSPQHEG